MRNWLPYRSAFGHSCQFGGLDKQDSPIIVKYYRVLFKVVPDTTGCSLNLCTGYFKLLVANNEHDPLLFDQIIVAIKPSTV